MRKYMDAIIADPNLYDSKNEQYVNFKNYACFASKTDFFNLYPLLRDRVVGYGHHGHPQLGIQLDQREKLQAELQTFLERIYQRSLQPNNWYVNEIILDQMYKLLELFMEYQVGTKLKLIRSPKFSITFSGDDPKIQINSRIEASALINLLNALRDLHFLNSASEDEYEIRAAFGSICINCGSELRESLCKECSTMPSHN
jgi:hypothetical protein